MLLCLEVPTQFKTNKCSNDFKNLINKLESLVIRLNQLPEKFLQNQERFDGDLNEEYQKGIDLLFEENLTLKLNIIAIIWSIINLTVYIAPNKNYLARKKANNLLQTNLKDWQSASTFLNSYNEIIFSITGHKFKSNIVLDDSGKIHFKTSKEEQSYLKKFYPSHFIKNGFMNLEIKLEGL